MALGLVLIHPNLNYFRPDAIIRQLRLKLVVTGLQQPMLSDVTWSKRNMVIFAVSLSIGLGLQLEPGALQHLPDTAKVLMTSGLLPAAFIAIILNLLLPEELADDQTNLISGGLSGDDEK